MVIGAYIYLENVQNSMHDLERELMTIANEERLRDQRWEQDDVGAVEKQDLQLQKLVLDHEGLFTILQGQTVMLGIMERENRESFLQRENRFEELEQEHKILTEAIHNGYHDIQFQLGVFDERTRRVLNLLSNHDTLEMVK